MLGEVVTACVIIPTVLAACWLLDRRSRALAARVEGAAARMEGAANAMEAAANAMEAHARTRQAAADRAEREWRKSA